MQHKLQASKNKRGKCVQWSHRPKLDLIQAFYIQRQSQRKACLIAKQNLFSCHMHDSCPEQWTNKAASGRIASKLGHFQMYVLSYSIYIFCEVTVVTEEGEQEFFDSPCRKNWVPKFFWLQSVMTEMKFSYMHPLAKSAHVPWPFRAFSVV